MALVTRTLATFSRRIPRAGWSVLLFFLAVARGLTKSALLISGLAGLMVAGVFFIDRGLPARVRDLVVTSRPHWTEWAESAPDFARSTRRDVDVTSGDSGGLTLHPGALQGQYVSQVHLFPSDWNALGIEWRAQAPAGTQVHIFWHASPDGKNWTDWEEAQLDDDLSAEAVSYSRLSLTPASRYLQYRVALSADTALVAPFVHGLRFVAFDSRTVSSGAVPSTTPTALPRPTTTATTTVEANGGLKVITRAAWGADESLMKRVPEYQKPTKIIVHHTAAVPQAGLGPEAVRALYYYQAATRGWGDLAYNYLIDPQGAVYEGRSGGDNVTGQHARQYSYGSIGIALLGNYDQEPMPDAMRESLVNLVAYLSDHYGIDPRGTSNFYDVPNAPNVMLARDVVSAVYPGQFIASALVEVRGQAWQRIQAYPPKLSQYGLASDRPVSGKKAIIAVGEGLLTSQVEFYVDEQLAQTVKDPTNGNQYVWDWDTTNTPDGSHVVKIVARGKNKSDSTLKSTYLVDNAGPKGALSINEGASYTRVPTLTLTITATDLSGIKDMQFVDPSGAAVTDPEPLALSKLVVLRPGDGPRLVALRFTDGIGNKSQVYSSTIFLDTQPPAEWRDYAGESDRVSISVTDKGSGVNLASARYALSENGSLWSGWEAARAEWDGKSQTARIVVPTFVTEPWAKFYVEDFAGNSSSSEAFTVKVLPGAPVPAATLTPAATVPSKFGTFTPTPKGGAPVTRTAAITRTATPLPAATVSGSNQRPDLMIDGVELLPQAVEAGQPATFVVTIRNQGAASKKGFWVALWIDPAQAVGMNAADPTRDNLVMWYVPSLAANGVLALTSSTPYAPYTTYSGRLPGGAHTIYVMVDAVNLDSKAGLVVESNEENNLLGPVQLAVQGNGPNPTTSLMKWILNWWERQK